MRISFTRIKDRTADKLYSASSWLSRQSNFVQRLGYGVLRVLLWFIYYIPASHMRRTSVAFHAAVKHASPRQIYGEFVEGVLLFARRIELLSSGDTEAIDKLLKIPERKRLDGVIEEHGGALLALPHCHGALLMVRGLSAQYDTLMLIREPKKDARAQAQRRYFANMGCEVLDVRRNNEAIVARTVLKALRGGKLVIGTVDRIKRPPSEAEPVSKEHDNVRATAFDQPVGAPGWPARFSAKCKVPILPVMVEQTNSDILLHVGEPIVATDVQSTTQAWLTALEEFLVRFPGQWIFVYDKHWSRLLRNRSDESTNI